MGNLYIFLLCMKSLIIISLKTVLVILALMFLLTIFTIEITPVIVVSAIASFLLINIILGDKK